MSQLNSAKVLWGPSSNIDLLFKDVNTGATLDGFDDDTIETGAPLESGYIPAREYELVIELVKGPGPTLVQWITNGGEIESAKPPRNGSLLSPQGNTEFTAAVGAVNDVQKFGELIIEDFIASRRYTI